MIDQIGGRKLAAVLITLALASVAVILKGDVPPNFVTLLEFLFGVFVAGNGVEHIAGAYTAGAQLPVAVAQDTSDAAPAVDLTPVMQKLDALESHEATTQQGVSAIQQTLTFIIQKTGIGNKA